MIFMNNTNNINNVNQLDTATIQQLFFELTKKQTKALFKPVQSEDYLHIEIVSV